MRCFSRDTDVIMEVVASWKAGEVTCVSLGCGCCGGRWAGEVGGSCFAFPGAGCMEYVGDCDGDTA